MGARLLAPLPGELNPEAAIALATDPTLAEWAALQDSAWANFRPRPDKPEEFDEQASFCRNRDLVAFFSGGNASGTTTGAAAKAAKFLLCDQPPPRQNTPFWIVSETYDQVMGVCWGEKLYGEKHIPDCEIDWDGIRWYDSKRGLPFSVPLKPWPGRPGKNWVLEFKSYKQGRRSMQARSIGGFWFSEQFPLSIFLEVLRGCREYMFPGGQFAEFTPIDPELCVWVEKVMDDPPEGWKFYRANTECNKSNLADGWYDQFFATVPDELLATRKTGALASFVGLIYPSFNPAVHVKEEPFAFPPNITHMRAVDWGASEEHPQTALWAYQDGMGDWFVYDEYWSADQTRITIDHAVEIMARSLFWGWPVPLHVFQSEDPILVRFCELAAGRLGEISPGRARWLKRFLAQPEPETVEPLRPRDTFGYTYADPSRPGEMRTFTAYGIQMAPASNNLYEGINCVRGLLKVNPFTGKPRLWIHPRCVHLVEELRKYRWRKGRTVADEAVLNPEVAKPVPLKRADDMCFPAGSLVDTPTGLRPIERLAPGDQVLSHLGVAYVSAAGKTGIRPVVRVEFSDGRFILCTEEHPLARANGGWVRAGEAQGKWIHCREGLSWQKEGPKRSRMAATRGAATLTPTDMPSGVTSADLNGEMASSGPSGCTFRFGKINTARCRKECTSTTKMEIVETTRLSTSNYRLLAITRNITRIVSRRRGSQRRNGMDRPTEPNGTGRTASELGRIESPSAGSVNTAAKTTKHSSAAQPDSAQTVVGLMLERLGETTTRVANVPFAERPSRSTVISRRNAARKAVLPVCVGRIAKQPGRQAVYNLSTSDGTYFVNGVLVSNCDSLRYLTFSPTRVLGEVPTSIDQRAIRPERRSIQLDRRSDRRR